MNTIQPGDVVVIIKVEKDQQPLLNKVGRVVMITDDVNCFVTFNDGKGAAVNISQLRKVR